MRQETLDEEWRRASASIDAEMCFSDHGLVLGAGTVLASASDGPRREIRIDGGDPRLLALLAAAHGGAASELGLAHLRKAADRWRDGDNGLAAVHLALSGLGRLMRPAEDVRRLFLADALLEAGLQPEELLKALDLAAPLAKYDPDQPRVPAGSGRTSGQWTSTGGGGGGDNAVSTSPRPAAIHNPRHAGTRPRPAGAGVRTSGRGATSGGPRGAAPTLSQRPTAKPTPSPAGASARGSPRPSQAATLAGAAAVAAGRAGAPDLGLDLGAMTAGTLGRVGAFIAGLGEIASVSTAAAGTAVVGGFGLAMIPDPEPSSDWVKVGGPGDVSYRFADDQTLSNKLYIRFRTADGVQRIITAGPDPDGGYRGPDGRTIARWVKTGAKAALMISVAALPEVDFDGPTLCPSPVKDNGGKLGQIYEDFMKARFNPGNPTPSGLAYNFFDPGTGAFVKIDDCQQRTGALGEYKGPNYEYHYLKDNGVWNGKMLRKMIEQAEKQDRARGDRPLIWFFDEKPVADRMREVFHKKELGIQVVWLPMPR